MKVYDKSEWVRTLICVECGTPMSDVCQNCGGILHKLTAKRWCYTQKPSFWRGVKELFARRSGYWEHSI